MATAFIGLDFINDIVNPEGKISHTAAPAAERGFAKGYADQPKHSPFFGRLHEIEALEAESSGMDFHPELKAELATRKENHANVESKCERGKHGASNSVENPACVAALRVEILRLRQLVADLLLKNQRLRHALGKAETVLADRSVEASSPQSAIPSSLGRSAPGVISGEEKSV
jgi:hypothetical protein